MFIGSRAWHNRHRTTNSNCTSTPQQVTDKRAPNPIQATRQNHALEHATIAILLRRGSIHTRIAGRASPGGFHVYGNFPTPLVEEAAHEALRRLKNGERDLAISPFCGTNIAVAGILAGLAAVLVMGSGNRMLNLPRVILSTIIAVLIAQPLGKIVQRHLTTYADPGGMVITGVSRSGVGPWPSHRIDTAFGLE